MLGEAAEEFEGVAVGLKRLLDRVGGGGAADGGRFRAGVFNRFARRLAGPFKDFVGALLGGDDQLVRADLHFGFLLRAVDDDLRLFAGLFKHAVALADQLLGLFQRGRRGRAQAIDRVEQLLAVDDPAAAEPRAAAGQHRVFQLVDDFEEVDVSLPPRLHHDWADRIFLQARGPHWAARGRRRGGAAPPARGCGWPK